MLTGDIVVCERLPPSLIQMQASVLFIADYIPNAQSIHIV